MSRTIQTWITVLAGPVVWFASMVANFAIASQVCVQHDKIALFAVVVVALLVALSAALFSRRLWRNAGADLPGESAGTAARRRALGLAGILLNGMFVVVIVAQSIPNLTFRGCE